MTRAAEAVNPKRVEIEGHLVVDEAKSIELDSTDVIYHGTSLKQLLGRVQIGGKRGYGFGRVEVREFRAAGNVFGATFEPLPAVNLPGGTPAAAHIYMEGSPLPLRGQQEPVVGREWREDDNLGAGQYITKPVFCYAPGAVFAFSHTFRIGAYGIWEAV